MPICCNSFECIFRVRGRLVSLLLAVVFVQLIQEVQFPEQTGFCYNQLWCPNSSPARRRRCFFAIILLDVILLCCVRVCLPSSFLLDPLGSSIEKHFARHCLVLAWQFRPGLTWFWFVCPLCSSFLSLSFQTVNLKCHVFTGLLWLLPLFLCATCRPSQSLWQRTATLTDFVFVVVFSKCT